MAQVIEKMMEEMRRKQEKMVQAMIGEFEEREAVLANNNRKRLKKLKRGNATCRGPVCVQDDCSTTVTRQSCRGVHCASCTHVHSSPGGCPSPPVLIMCYVPHLYAIHMMPDYTVQCPVRSLLALLC